ncbi:TOM1-like protein 4 [Selaginella moellendorffii]|uniref:TOM1-like protein 4 n=1 Tax=Selaginella moellendorffii TaxID=88036 RepID=UPI000D1CBA9B|nr:TOM1-like protein 4 [Selaginella moellendorffii]|eukprot:XP_024519677.1 TOM1-like protein 4 [Selaginella moellendorffii]
MSVASLVDKATSDLLIGPDWGRNLEICDALNNDPGQAKEVVKAARKRLAHKNPTVQLLTLTVLETLVKNCGDAVHQQVAEKDVLHEMVKIVKKRGDLSVREKILGLLDSWQEAFGGQRGRYPQFFSAYDELRRSGVDFPQRQDAPPIFTPPQSHPITAYPAPGFVAAAASPEPPLPPLDVDIQRLSLADLDSARSGMEVLSEMLNAIDPRDKSALREELIVELVEQCQRTQKQVMHLVSTTSDETLLFQALSLNDDLQKVLAKRDAMASGATPAAGKQPEAPPAPVFPRVEEEGEDDFARLARRSRQNSDQPAPKPSAPPQLVRIPGPPVPQTRIQPPSNNKSTKPTSEDLLSGEAFGAGGAASDSKKAAVLHTHGLDELEEPEENINPFALRKQPSNGAAPATSTPQPLPPPPQKNSQRQQFFQHHRPVWDEDRSEQEHMHNPYAALFDQPKQQQQAEKPTAMSSSATPSSSNSLFSDLVDLQGARMKRL